MITVIYYLLIVINFILFFLWCLNRIGLEIVKIKWVEIALFLAIAIMVAFDIIEAREIEHQVFHDHFSHIDENSHMRYSNYFFYTFLVIFVFRRMLKTEEVDDKSRYMKTKESTSSKIKI